MSVSWQVPRNCLVWAMMSQVALLLPHVQRLPWWMMLAYVICALWRIMIYQGRWSLPPKFLKSILAVVCCAGIYLSYGSFIGLEPTIALLFSGMFLKLLELNMRRDVYVLIFLSIFASLTAFLFSQNIGITLYIFLALLMVVTSLVALHQHDLTRLSINSLKKTAVIFLQAVPLMVVLFIIFPRFEPFWTVPSPSQNAKTGVSETMGPGDISNLSQSGELAFRAVFNSVVPTREDMYWRGLVLSRFDGRVWHQGRNTKRLFSQSEVSQLKSATNIDYDYTIFLEPTHQRWLFSLPLAFSDERLVRMSSDYRLIRLNPVSNRIKYRVQSDEGAVIDRELVPYQLQREIFLPAGSNPETRLWAQQLYLSSEDNEAFINAVLKHFRSEPFYYTLQPPLLGEHTVDEFLFQTRQGFCEHYASSFVFIMRSVGIPARVVTGYQGGEINPLTGTVLVHQYDAHAWVEVWLPERGWTRVDPTAAVSPLRIESGLEAALAALEQGFLSDSVFSPQRYRYIQSLNYLWLQLDAINYYWISFVLDFNDERQVDFLKKLIGDVTPLRIAMLLISVGGIVLLLVAMQLLKGRTGEKSSPESVLYLSVCRRLAKAGYPRSDNEAPIDYCRRIIELKPELSQHLQAVTRTYVTLSYESYPREQRKHLISQLRNETTKLSYQLRAI